MVVRYMRLTVYSHDCTVCVYHCDSIINAVYMSFIKAYGNNCIKLLCQRRKSLYGRILHSFMCKRIIIVISLLAKIQILKKLRQKYHLCALCCCAANQFLCLINIYSAVRGHRHLNCGCFYSFHIIPPIYFSVLL